MNLVLVLTGLMSSLQYTLRILDDILCGSSMFELGSVCFHFWFMGHLGVDHSVMSSSTVIPHAFKSLYNLQLISQVIKTPHES